MTERKLPQTDSVQELAQFWDTHDLTDFDDELEEVTEPVFERQRVLRVRLTSEEAQALQKMAQAQGTRSAVLIRRWILEKVGSG